MPRQFVEHLRNGQSVDEIFLLTEKQLRANRNGDLFLLVHLKDRTGEVHGLMWNVTEDSVAGFDTGDFVRVEGKVQLYQGALQTILTRVNAVSTAAIEMSDFEEDRSEASERQMARVDELLRNLGNQDLRELMICFLDDEPLIKAFTRAVAGVKIHHAFRGGLLEHVSTLMEAADQISKLYPFLDRDLLLAGVFLHDLGKVILRQTMEREFRRIANYVDRADMLFYQAEEKVLGVNHGEMGGWLLEKWALPPNLVEPIVDHHDFRPNRDYAEDTAILHLADILCRAQAFGSGGDRKIPRLAPSALETLKLTIDDVCEIMGRMHEELRDIPRM